MHSNAEHWNENNENNENVPDFFQKAGDLTSLIGQIREISTSCCYRCGDVMNRFVRHNRPLHLRPAITIADHQRSPINQELRSKIQTALQAAQPLSAQDCLQTIRERLVAIQAYCKTRHKVFIFVEEPITCDQYDLGGQRQDTAILFRGPSTDASVAICVTCKGSLLHRNGYPWKIYKNAGDVNPVNSLPHAN